MAITNLSEFQDTFPHYSFLESRSGHSRYSNGLDENSSYASAWFNDETEEIAINPDLM